MNSKIVFFTLLSALLAQEAGKLSEESLKCMKEKNCGTDLNCIPACFKGTEIPADLAQKAVDCMTKNCLREAADQNKLIACAGSCYAGIAKDEKKDDDKDKKEDDNKDKKEDDKDKKEDDKKEDDKDKKEDDKEKKEENKDEKKEGDKDKKDDNKDKKDDSKEKKDEPKMAENANKGNSASALTGSAAFAIVLSAISMVL